MWRENRWVKQLRIGDVPSTGTRGRPLEGAAITNTPYVRPSFVGALRYTGRLEPGWSVEAYRGGDLVAYDSADPSGGFSMNLPVRYGENPVDFVAYGPFGEIREFNRTYRLVADELEPLPPSVGELHAHPAWSRVSPAASAALKMIDGEHTLLFASSYPDWTLGDPFDMLRDIPDEIRHRVMSENAVSTDTPRASISASTADSQYPSEPLGRRQRLN